MKQPKLLALMATISSLFCATILMGCGDDQSIPAGTTISDPVGANKNPAAAGAPATGGPTAEQVKASQKIGEDARQFGQEMNAKYGNR